MSVVMLKVVALILQSVECFIFNSPTRSSDSRIVDELISFQVDICYPAKTLAWITRFRIELEMLQEIDANIFVR